MENFALDTSSLDLALTAKGKHRGKPWDKHTGRFQAKQKGMAQSDTYIKRKVECDYCAKPGHLAKDSFKRKSRELKNHESKQRYRSHNGNFVHKNASLNDGFKNLKLFIYEAALSIEIDDENAWLIDYGASTHMSYNRTWYDGYYENLDGI